MTFATEHIGLCLHFFIRVPRLALSNTVPKHVCRLCTCIDISVFSRARELLASTVKLRRASKKA